MKINFFRYDVAKPEDLFASFDKVLKENNFSIGKELTVEEFMSNWTTQAGYPVLIIEKNKSANNLIVTQVIYSCCSYYLITYF